MEEDEIQAQACKFPRAGNGNKVGSRGNNNSEQFPDEEEDGGELRNRRGGGGGSDGSTNRFHHSSSWHHHSSRIIRVSRASGGKDRHSKVMTSKGLRDRRVRLSVATAIQFYDLQDRLGYDQPSKAVEWLIKAAAEAISELPSLNNTFPETPRQPSNERRPSVGAEREQGLFDEDPNNYPQQNQSQNLSLSKSACSSTSETSKGSDLSLSRCEIRVKARKRARERTAREKEKEKEKENELRSVNVNAHHHHHRHNVDNNNNNNNQMSQTASFTELLTGAIGNNSTVTVPNTAPSPTGSVHQIHGGGDEVNLFNKATTTTTTTTRQHWSSTVTPIMDCFSSGLLVGPSSSRIHQTSPSGFSGQIQLGTSLPVSPFSGENHSDQLQQFSFMPDQLVMPAVVTSSHQPGGGDYNLNFTISSSGFAGYNRGTLQSNSHHHPSLLPHLQRFSPMDGSSSHVPNFFMGVAAAPGSAAPTMDNHHHHPFSPVLDGPLQLYYGDGSRHSDQKGKGKN